MTIRILLRPSIGESLHPPERGKIKGSLKFRDDALVVEDNQNKKILILYSDKTTTTKKNTPNHKP